MGFVVKRPSRMKGQCFSQSWAGWTVVFGRAHKVLKELWLLTNKDLTHPESSWGRVECPSFFSIRCEITKIE